MIFAKRPKNGGHHRFYPDVRGAAPTFLVASGIARGEKEGEEQTTELHVEDENRSTASTSPSYSKVNGLV